MNNTPTFQVGDLVRGVNSGTIFRVLGVELDDSVRGEVVAPGKGVGHRNHHVGNIAYNHPEMLELITTITNTKENTTMNSDLINRAIDQLRAEDVAKATKPVYRKIAKLVGKVDVGQAIVITKPGDETFGVQFRVRTGENQWEYGNGTSYHDTDHVIATLTRWAMEGATVTRLVEAS